MIALKKGSLMASSRNNTTSSALSPNNTLIASQKPCTDMDFDVDSIKNLNLSEHFSQEWNKGKWYSVSAIASKLGIHRNTVAYWRDFGIKINEVTIRLKMIKRPNLWYS
jgi:hypothetical protein